jgi:glycosyltransferase involved in cell wall biosynthesis
VLRPASNKRLGVYVDAVYVSTPDGVRVDPIDAAFLSFVAEVGTRFDRSMVFGRTVDGDDAEQARAFVQLPTSLELERLPYYRNLGDVRAVGRSVGGTLRSFWRGLGGVDVVWVFGPHPLAIALVVLARIRRKRVVLGVRQDTVEYFRSRVATRRSRRVLMGTARMLDLAYRGLARRVPTTVVGSQIAACYGGPRAGLHEMVVSLVRAEDVLPGLEARPNRRPGPILLLSVGRIEPEKTPLVLVDALSLLEQERPGRYRLRWIGHGRLEQDVRDHAAALGLEALIELLGHVPFGPELLASYREADVFVHVAATEGVPQVLVEALAAGTPVVATDVGGVRTLIEDEETGLLVRPRNPRAVAAAILRLEDTDLCRRLAQAGLERARQATLEAEADAVTRFLTASP